MLSHSVSSIFSFA